MASQELCPASLPDTQNADALTQSQEVPSSQQPTLTIWGRLFPVRRRLLGHDLIHNSYTVGRALDCNISITTSELEGRQWGVISKTQFRIVREYINNETVVYLEDLSRNGTFVDQDLVGSGNRVVIGHNSKIAIAKDSLTFYIFMSTNPNETALELPLELRRKYTIGRKLGAGACGEVRLLFAKNGSSKFAIKIIKKNNFNIGSGNIINNSANVRNEAEILRRLSHPCVIHLEDIYDTTGFMYIILELMEGGELFDRIKNRGKLSESCAKLICYQVVLAVHYLHKQGITHRDLKPENILLKDNSDCPLVKVSDFGMSKFVDAQTMMRTFCGTPMYVAPEILATRGYSTYTNQVDVWSLGVILYVSLSGKVPFPNNPTVQQQQIINGAYRFPREHFDRVSDVALKLIKSMMTVNPKQRITVTRILLHEWLRDTNMRREVNRLITGDRMENDENVPPMNLCNKRPRLMI